MSTLTSIICTPDLFFFQNFSPLPNVQDHINTADFLIANKDLFKQNSISNDTIARLLRDSNIEIYPFLPKASVFGEFIPRLNDYTKFMSIYVGGIIKKFNLNIPKNCIPYFKNGNSVYCDICEKNVPLTNNKNDIDNHLSGCLKKKFSAYLVGLCPFCPYLNITPEEMELHILTTGHFNKFFSSFQLGNDGKYYSVNAQSSQKNPYIKFSFTYDMVHYHKYVSKFTTIEAVSSLANKQAAHQHRDSFNIVPWLRTIKNYAESNSIEYIPCELCFEDLNNGSPISIQKILMSGEDFTFTQCSCGEGNGIVYDQKAKNTLYCIINGVVTNKSVKQVNSNTLDHHVAQPQAKRKEVANLTRSLVLFGNIYNSTKSDKITTIINTFNHDVLRIGYLYFKGNYSKFYDYMDVIYSEGGFNQNVFNTVFNDMTNDYALATVFFFYHNKLKIINTKRLTLEQYNTILKYLPGQESAFKFGSTNISEAANFSDFFSTDSDQDPHDIYFKFYIDFFKPNNQDFYENMEWQQEFHDFEAPNQPQKEPEKPVLTKGQQKVLSFYNSIADSIGLDKSKDVNAQISSLRKIMRLHHPDKLTNRIPINQGESQADYAKRLETIAQATVWQQQILGGIMNYLKDIADTPFKLPPASACPD